MRKAQKKQVREFIMLLAEAQQEIKTAIENQNITLALDLLEQCQQGAIQVGTLIDTLEGEGFITVTLLEQYCELVYQLHEDVVQWEETKTDITTLTERIETCLTDAWKKINNSVENDIPERIEVVFCPYKASMWDSLESVWKAASEDENCDAYVIPIPYYDRNPDKSFGEIHYEGLEYPEYVPITYYKSYNFEERRPDIVFIHNPYDELNYVTTVHPFYYSKNLKQYTDKLVYIPYFVLGEADSANLTPQRKEKISQFCMQPAVIHADQVILQSEAMKQIYVNILCENFGEETRSQWETKILGLGSPKYDKVRSTNEADLKIPEEWLSILYKPDGTKRKVILYNTSVTTLLDTRERMLIKMRDTFHVFYESREEVALLWRPHPLIQATIESMLPRLWNDYMKLVEEYKTAGWGIYDDSAELNRALELADAYYGDTSSLVQLCQDKGIPVMIQDVDVLEYYD